MPRRSSSAPTAKGFAAVACGGFDWVSVTDPSEANLAKLRKRYPFVLESDLKELQPPFQHPKLLERDDYLFLVLLFPLYDAANNDVRPTEVDFLIGKDFLVTNHTGELPSLAGLAGEQKTCLGEPSPERMVYRIIRAVHASLFPVLTRISNDILELERSVQDRLDESTLREILHLKSQVIDFRRILQGHQHALRRMSEKARRLLGRSDKMVHYDKLIGHLEEMEGFLENDKETLDAIYNSKVSLMAFRTSQATQSLSGIALTVFPTTLVAAIFAMRAEHMPFLGGKWDFWIMLGFVLLTMLITTAYLRDKKLL